MIRRLIFLMLLIPSLLCASGQKEDSAPENMSIRIFASNYPLYFAAESILGDQEAELLWPFPEGEDPAFWEPGREDLAELQAARLLLFNGADYEKWSRYAFLDESQIRDCSELIRDSFIVSGEGQTHSHGGGAEHSHGGTAFTLWLDLKQYGEQLRSVEGALVELFPGREQDFRENAEQLLDEINTLDRAFSEAGAAFEKEILLASHPIYQYFARAYLGELRTMLWEPGIYPSEDEWTILEGLKGESPARFMLWEDEPLPETRERLEEMGLELIIVKPGFSIPESGTFVDILNSNLSELRRAGESL